MDMKQFFEWAGVITLIGGISLWMISHQLVINYTQKHLKSICKYLYGNENHYTGKLGIVEMLLITTPAPAILIHYFLFYKRKGYLRIYKNPEKSMYPNLTEKNALLIVKEHYKWLILCSVSFILSLTWLVGTSLFMWLSEKVG